MSDTEKPKRPQVRLGTLLLLMTIAAISMGWWADHRRLSQKPAAKDAELRVFALKRTKATFVVPVLEQQFPGSKANPTLITADPRLNTVIVRSDADTLENIGAVLLTLDRAAATPVMIGTNGGP